MMAAEIDRVRIELVEAQARGRVIRSDHGTGAYTDEHIDRNAFRYQPAEYANMCRAAQSAGAQHDADPHRPLTPTIISLDADGNRVVISFAPRTVPIPTWVNTAVDGGR